MQSVVKILHRVMWVLALVFLILIGFEWLRSHNGFLKIGWRTWDFNTLRGYKVEAVSFDGRLMLAWGDNIEFATLSKFAYRPFLGAGPMAQAPNLPLDVRLDTWSSSSSLSYSQVLTERVFRPSMWKRWWFGYSQVHGVLSAGPAGSRQKYPTIETKLLLPYWFLILVPISYLLLSVRRLSRMLVRRKWRLHGCCTACGYSMEGSGKSGASCPECGEIFSK